MRDFRKITARQKADDLAVGIYQQTRSYPREELYVLTSQMRRAAYSVPSNIAEGASRNSKKDYLHFLYMARGSLSEVGYFVHLSKRLGYLDIDPHTHLSEQADEASRILAGLINSVESEVGPLKRVEIANWGL